MRKHARLCVILLTALLLAGCVVTSPPPPGTVYTTAPVVAAPPPAVLYVPPVELQLNVFRGLTYWDHGHQYYYRGYRGGIHVYRRY